MCEFTGVPVEWVILGHCVLVVKLIGVIRATLLSHIHTEERWEVGRKAGDDELRDIDVLKHKNKKDHTVWISQFANSISSESFVLTEIQRAFVSANDRRIYATVTATPFNTTEK